jgi:hypothetical protein
MRPLHGHGGLAHPCRADQRRDHHSPRRVSVAEHARQGIKLRGPAGEVAYRGRQLAGHHRRGRLSGNRYRRDRAVGAPIVAARLAQAQRRGDQLDRTAARPADEAAFDIADGPHAQPSPLREILLGEPGDGPGLAYKGAEIVRMGRSRNHASPQRALILA